MVWQSRQTLPALLCVLNAQCISLRSFLWQLVHSATFGNLIASPALASVTISAALESTWQLSHDWAWCVRTDGVLLSMSLWQATHFFPRVCLLRAETFSVS